MPQDIIGWIHTLAAIIALISGSMVLAKTKGSLQHKRTGRVYGMAMLVVCITSFMIYRVHNAFGILHILAIISSITLILGMFPLYFKGYKNPILTHLSWMYWSVIGLYCAFAAEIFTRLPMLLDIKDAFGIFYGIIGLSAGFVGFIGSHFFKKKKKVWKERFAS